MVIGIEAAHANVAKRSGVEEYCYQIIQSLKKVIPATEEVVLYSNAPLRDELADLPANWKVKVLHWPFSKGWSKFRLSLHFLFHKPDVFFSPGQLVPDICPKRTITMIHDCAFLVYPGAYGYLSRTYLKRMNLKILKKSSKLLTSSEFNRKEIERLYGVPASKKVSVVPLAFEPVEPPANFNPKDFNITKPYVMTAGRLEMKKNTKQLIQAFSVVKQTNDLQLVLVGRPGVGYKEIEKELALCPYKEDIIRLEFVDRPQLAGLMKHALAFVFPSLYEGFGLPLLEAFSLGVPTIASRIDALQEVGGSAAAFVDPLDVKALADEIVHIAKDTGEQIKYSHEGKERSNLFSWEKTATATWDVIAKE